MTSEDKAATSHKVVTLGSARVSPHGDRAPTTIRPITKSKETTMKPEHPHPTVSPLPLVEPDLPSCWRDVADALAAGIDRLILFGPPGTGKTFSGLTMGNVIGGSFRLICNEDMTAADVTGHFMPSGDGTWKWLDGSVLRAWQGNGQIGGRIVADEIDRASGDVLSLLLNMFDSPESASWQHPDSGELFKPLKDFSVVMTTNIEDMRDLPTALRDRFPIAIRIDRPHPGALTQLSPHLRAPASAAVDADKARRFSVRSFMAFDQLCITGMDIERAAYLVFGNHSKDILDAIRVDAVSKPASKSGHKSASRPVAKAS